MQHSQIRKLNETVKIFSKTTSTQTIGLDIFVFDGSLTQITHNYQISPLNTGYYSSEIVTPNYDCYLLIKFNENPIVLRVGNPTLNFFYWSNSQSVIFPYIHYDEFGTKIDEGSLIPLGQGFHYITPVSSNLGYIEVEGVPYIVHLPYTTNLSGIVIQVDWKKKVKRINFGVSKKIHNFKLNKYNNTFKVKTITNQFTLNRIQKRFNNRKLIKKFKVTCRR